MKSSVAFKPEAKNPDQSLGRGVKTTSSPSRRIKTSLSVSEKMTAIEYLTIY
jgi:hypothetical protein